jgi:hypothetical protein
MIKFGCPLRQAYVSAATYDNGVNVLWQIVLTQERIPDDLKLLSVVLDGVC